MRKLSLILLFLLVICAMGGKYALLVGINDQQNGIAALKYCVADVEAFRDALVETAGYTPENVHLMTHRDTVLAKALTRPLRCDKVRPCCYLPTLC